MKQLCLIFAFLLTACANPAPAQSTAQATPVPEAPQATAPPVIRHAWSCPAYINSSYYVMDSDGYDVVVTAVCDMSGTISMSLKDSTLITVELGVRDDNIHWIGAVGKPLGDKTEEYTCTGSWTEQSGEILLQMDTVHLPADTERIAMHCWSIAGTYHVWAEWSSQPFIQPTPNPLFETG